MRMPSKASPAVTSPPPAPHGKQGASPLRPDSCRQDKHRQRPCDAPPPAGRVAFIPFARPIPSCSRVPPEHTAGGSSAVRCPGKTAAAAFQPRVALNLPWFRCSLYGAIAPPNQRPPINHRAGDPSAAHPCSDSTLSATGTTPPHRSAITAIWLNPTRKTTPIPTNSRRRFRKPIGVRNGNPNIPGTETQSPPEKSF